MISAVALISWLRQTQRRHRAIPLAVLGISLWSAMLGNGIFMMSSFGYTPGPSGAAPTIWPHESSLSHDSSRATLLLFAHPRCPCTTASLAQLKQILTETSVPVHCQIVFLTPPQANADWKASKIVRMAETISAVTIVMDPGAETRRFAAATSGQVLLYDTSGRLTFSGGITASRGHLGHNSGTQSVIQILNHQPTNNPHTPIFGCPLFQDTSSCRESTSCQN